MQNAEQGAWVLSGVTILGKAANFCQRWRKPTTFYHLQPAHHGKREVHGPKM